MILPIVISILGIVVLIYGANFLVAGSASLARKMGLSTMVVGLTVVAFGTSAPELVVNIFSAVRGSTDIAIGNILGSNIANILLILGISALIAPLTVQRNTVWKEIPFALLAAILVFTMGHDTLLDHRGNDAITRIDGISLMAIFIIFMYYIFGIAKLKAEEGPVKIYPNWQAGFMTVGGILGLFFGGKMLVDSAVELASMAGISETLIGLTIVAVGTSLPEMVTSIVAVRKGQNDIAVGNIVGSNIFNIFWIIGLTAIIEPLPFHAVVSFDALVTIGATLLLFLVMFVGRRHTLDRWQGAMFVLLYFAYVVYIVMRG